MVLLLSTRIKPTSLMITTGIFESTPSSTPIYILSRSRIFSLGLGLMFTGMAVGPTLGAFMIRSTGQLLSVYYVAAGIHTLYAFLVWFVLPQSLSLSYRLRAREKYAEELRAGVSERGDRLGVRLLVLFKRLFSFLTPLAVFGPEAKEINNNPLKKRRDWNLTLMSLAYAFTITIMVRALFELGNSFLTSTVGFLYLQVPICCFNLRLDFGNCEPSRILKF